MRRGFSILLRKILFNGGNPGGSTGLALPDYVTHVIMVIASTSQLGAGGVYRKCNIAKMVTWLANMGENCCACKIASIYKVNVVMAVIKHLYNDHTCSTNSFSNSQHANLGNV